MARFSPLISLPWLLVSVTFLAVDATTFTLVNKCEYTIWPGVLANAGEPPLSTTGFALQKGESRPLSAPAGWGGRFWARTRCAQDPATGELSCLTGDCGSGQLECGGGGAVPPATLAEFKLDGDGGLDFFDVSLVDGYNLPVLVAPKGGGGGGRGNCTSVRCAVDLEGACPSELRVTARGDGSGVAACKSACDAFRQPQYCCSGSYSSPQACKPTSYSEVFKSACPQAYSYAYDDETSTFTCAGADYVITFCPTPSTSQKAASSQDQTPGAAATDTPLINGTMVYVGVAEASRASRSARTQVPAVGLVGVAVSTWRLRHLLSA
ncbi:thaumatin-like protein 1b [Rhodamnia argentea]|uniref:Thaumatin-like protein 1b n=1 Tax=Rhodamnia argentea TaxID=178133 RepID=A0A8B8NX91_9MYRT|nr:thaumatin-like protein 1b [Rhodamnia argentea]